MKKILYPLVILSFLMTSCVNDSADFNDDKDKPYDVPAGTLLTNAEKQLVDQMTTPEVNLNPFRYFSQYWAATQYTTESRYRLTTRTIPDNHWLILYANVLGNLKSTKDAIAVEVKPLAMSEADFLAQQTNKLAIVDILQVYTFQIIVDTFGDVPYTDALDPTIVLPKYDDDASIYPKLITRLDEAIADLDNTAGSFGSEEYIYKGDVDHWVIFANSLKVKLAINLADVDAALAQSTIEDAVAAGVITDNSDNAIFNYPSSAPNYNPIYDQLVASQRDDFVPADTFVNALNTLEDPRRTKYFTLHNTYDDDGNIISSEYIGGQYGFANGYPSFSHVNDILQQPDFPSLLIEATEMNFYLAEAAARGYAVGGSAESYYDAAITASFENWGLTTTEASAYLANPAVAYTTAAGTWQQKIGTQAWIALFNRGFESWNSYRRLDYPALVAPSNAYPEAEGEVPKRFPYPVNEQTVNSQNYQSASAAIGGDAMKTHVFWDIH